MLTATKGYLRDRSGETESARTGVIIIPGIVLREALRQHTEMSLE